MELNTWQSQGLLSGAELDPVKSSHWRAMKEGLWPHGCASSTSGHILMRYSKDIHIIYLPVLVHERVIFLLFVFYPHKSHSLMWDNGGWLCAHCSPELCTFPDGPSCCPGHRGLSSPSPLAFQTDACLAHCCPADHKSWFTLPRGTGNFRWIILGPGEPVLNRTYSLSLATLSHVHCVLIGCACVTPLGKSLSVLHFSYCFLV